MCKTTLICVQLVPPLPACTVCGLHRTRLVRVDLFEAKSEYYVHCQACGECSWIMFDILCPTQKREDKEICLRQLEMWDVGTRKKWVS